MTALKERQTCPAFIRLLRELIFSQR